MLDDNNLRRKYTMIYQYKSSEPRWISFENRTGEKGRGGTENNGAKGHPFEMLLAKEEKMLCDFDGCGIVDIRLDSIPSDIYTADIYMLDGVKDMTLADSIPITGEKKRLILNISKYGAAMIRLY